SDVDCYCVIQNCNFSGINNGNGFRFSNLEHATIADCVFNNTNSAIYLYNCNNTKILNNTMISEDGIRGCVSANVVISNNCIRNSHYAIMSEVLHNVSIANNTILYSGYGIHHIGENGSITGNIIAASKRVGIMIDDRWGNSTIYGNQIGFCEEFNARDDSFGEENIWDDGESIGNSWSDLGDDTTYTIPGDAGSIDRYPSHFTIDVLGPSIDLEYYMLSEYSLKEPDNSFTFQTNVWDVSGVDTVLLYTKYSDVESEGWTVYEMSPIESYSIYSHQCTITGLRTGSIIHYVWANDTLRNWFETTLRLVQVKTPYQMVYLLIPSVVLGAIVIGGVVSCKVLSNRKAIQELDDTKYCHSP
ncbi:MAG: NosD domain-containing protein, partial [Candidatus Thorarchaeota archaeon]|nr:NosD domain-containing protein [Candidatus Thorarchaeota archaeon]